MHPKEVARERCGGCAAPANVWMQPDAHLLITLLILATGALVFVRLVAKEKHRRDRHLEYRLQEKLKAAEEAAKRSERQSGATPAAARTP